MPLRSAQRRILIEIARGATLKSHRYLDGEKTYRLHSLNGTKEDVHSGVIADLIRRGYVQSNQKFPAATLLLSPEGKRVAARLVGQDGTRQ